MWNSQQNIITMNCREPKIILVESNTFPSEYLLCALISFVELIQLKQADVILWAHILPFYDYYYIGTTFPRNKSNWWAARNYAATTITFFFSSVFYVQLISRLYFKRNCSGFTDDDVKLGQWVTFIACQLNVKVWRKMTVNLILKRKIHWKIIIQFFGSVFQLFCHFIKFTQNENRLWINCWIRFGLTLVLCWFPIRTCTSTFSFEVLFLVGFGSHSRCNVPLILI